MTTLLEEVDLNEFVARSESQAAAAEALGCTQGNISQALRDIEAGAKTVRVRIYKNGLAEADIIKPFGSRKSQKVA